MTDHMLKNVHIPSAEMTTNKAELSVKVSQVIIKQGLLHSSLVLKDVDWFFFRMGISDSYFETTSASDIATHISAIYAGKILAKFGEHHFHIKQESEERAFFAVRSFPGSRHAPSFALESDIEDQYLLQGYSGQTRAKVSTPFRLKVFRTDNPISADSDIRLRFYLLEKPQFKESSGSLFNETDLSIVGDPAFLKRSHGHTRDVYQDLVTQVVQGDHPVIVSAQSTEHPEEKRVCVAYRHGTAHSLFSVLSDVYHYRNLYAPKKYVEQFANGVTVICAYLRPVECLEGGECCPREFQRRIDDVVDDVSVLQVLPRTSLSFLFRNSVLSAHEVTYAYCCWKFAHQFLSKYQNEYNALYDSIVLHDPQTMGHLVKLKHNLRKDTFTESKVSESLVQYPEVIKKLCADFEQRFNPELAPIGGISSLPQDCCDDIEEFIKKAAASEFDLIVLFSILKFNQHILKTNFFKPNKKAIAFRLDPEFLSKEEYPVTPYGIFYLIGGEFRGFHVRFQDISRGGIRLIRSRNAQAFSQTVGRLFDENYDLANTQQRKNKDIPEGGSKGTILLSLSHQDKGEIAFRKYIDALLDLLLPSDDVIDYYKKEEILFCGPDEGTADFMDWASNYAKKRNASFWKAFTTGKSLSFGGIPHDRYGMTTRSVHQYVLGILSKLGRTEESITKFQTGGPDGDLGSNEILISKDKTLAIVDGSGVLYDPEGIDREEMERLAKKRLMVSEFDMKKISRNGFYVSVEDRNFTLPDGVHIPNGLFFRNSFHLSSYAVADVFVPCGGRPEAVDINNVHLMLHENGEPKFKIIVEGANLFFTQAARLKLEEAGVILYKDASANKGGVTSSSLEVLAALAMGDEEFSEHMTVKEGRGVPEFYEKYVQQVQEMIEENARLEFECIWKEHEKTAVLRSVISDLLSNKINKLHDDLVTSHLWDNQKLREKVVRQHCPPILIEKFGLDTVMQRVPESYLKAIFGSQLASRFIYKYGIDAPEFAFFDYMEHQLSNN